jgi:anti-sigma regulatory factor (Ser/Thr protein kinase)
VTTKRSFDAYENSVGRARRFVSGFTADLPDDRRDDVALMISELATNALVHASSGFDVAIDRSTTLLRVSVSDRGDGTPEVHSPNSTEPHGRGLQIVEALSDEWGVIPYFAAGKTVWFQIALEAATPSGGEHDTTGATRHHRRDRAEPRSARPGSSADSSEYGDSGRPSVNRAKSQRPPGQRRLPTGGCRRARPAVWHWPSVATGTRRRDCFVGTRCDQGQPRGPGGHGRKSGRDAF